MIDTVAAKSEDEAFLFQLYSLSRQDELQSWNWGLAEQEQFLHMQWRAQTMSYAASYPGANRMIVRKNGVPVGQMYVFEKGSEWVLIDISLLPEYRNQGIGTSLILDLQHQANRAGARIHLSVLPMNRATNLYQKLDFFPVHSTGLHQLMEWHASKTSKSEPKFNEVRTNE
ncbi:GNAT family N-acetyltransferase [Paenibacillus xylanilyticus]|uniref:GNAT family N-acetyltransferase n=1 Tax=Paenibacillus xylanilyticus TaxID=248903 RepID=UPI00138A0761|nr:GNAT family N-acetyltransferase [Paenibacillus xylanilyticus]